MKTILVVDDNDVSRELARDGLESCGYAVVEASNGQEALDCLRENRPDLVLLDIQMPLLDGYATLRRIREDPVFAATPVIALTAFAMQGDSEKALAAGFNAHITKPIRVSLLRREVERFLKDPS